MWKVAVAHIGTDEFEELTRDGWEPFGVTAVGDPSRSHNLYHFRRLLPEPTFNQLFPDLHNEHTLTRTQTLKEVGQWLDEQHFRVLQSDCCYLLNKLQKAMLKGEMP